MTKEASLKYRLGILFTPLKMVKQEEPSRFLVWLAGEIKENVKGGFQNVSQCFTHNLAGLLAVISA